MNFALHREAVASFFDPSVSAIVDAVHSQKAEADVPISVRAYPFVPAAAECFFVEDRDLCWWLRSQ
jgi:hypothetical protein